MIDLMEKIVAAVCGILLLGTVVWYLAFKLPSPSAAAWLPEVYEEKPPAAADPSPEEPERPPVVRPEMQKIAESLQKQTGKLIAPQELARTEKTMKVPAQLFEVLEAEANIMPQLKTAKSRPIQTADGETRLQIFSIQPSSFLGKFGFKDNDVIELLDGQIIKFDQTSTREMYTLWDATRQKLRAGGNVSVTVTRDNRPQHINFRLE